MSLEEKQRLAKEQEQQRFLKAQKPLETKLASSTAKTQPKRQLNSQPKDLTATLMSSNLSNMSLSSPSKPLSSSSVGGMSNMGAGARTSSGLAQSNYSINTPSLSTMGGSASYSSPMSQSSFGMSSNSSGFGTPSLGMAANSQQQNKQMDLSAFDSLLPSSSNQQKMPMNQMVQSKGSSPWQQGTMGMGGQGQIGNQGMMGTPRMMGNQGMMGNPSMAAQQSMMGNFGGNTMTGGYGGMNLNQGFNSSMPQNNAGLFQPASNQGMMQPQQVGNMNMSSNQTQSINDLNDFLG